jgi:hypothetical protein
VPVPSDPGPAAPRQILPVSISAFLLLAALGLVLDGCSQRVSRYALVDDSLRAGDPARADQVVERAEPEYGAAGRVLYRMDRGMTLHLAHRYRESNVLLEQAEEEIERLYTRRVGTETKAFLVNDTLLPYEGDPYEQVMVNVLKALNYAALGLWDDALVEARRIDHRLNVLSDQADGRNSYRDDAFARYLTGVLYEVTGDTNNAFIAFRKAYEYYSQSISWTHVQVPHGLRADLLRTTEALQLAQEHEEYRQAFPDAAWQPSAVTGQLAHIVVISYNGRAPRKEDLFLDLPVSLDALRLVLLTKSVVGPGNQDSRAAESLLYGLNGRVVRVAVPTLMPQKTPVAYSQISLLGANDTVSGRTELAQNIAALAERSLGERFGRIAMKAVARAAVKYALAEGVGHGARMAAGHNDAGPLIGLLVGSLAHLLALSSEEADKQSWRTLPDEIQIARLWIAPGTYELRLRSVTKTGEVGRESVQSVTLQAGETRFVTQRVLP